MAKKTSKKKAAKKPATKKKAAKKNAAKKNAAKKSNPNLTAGSKDQLVALIFNQDYGAATKPFPGGPLQTEHDAHRSWVKNKLLANPATALAGYGFTSAETTMLTDVLNRLTDRVLRDCYDEIEDKFHKAHHGPASHAY